MFKKSLLTLALLGTTAVANANVLTSIKPLGFISSAITDGVTETEVLLPVTASPHDYSLKPSDIKKLKSADLVVWIGDEMETFLDRILSKYPESKVLELENIPEIAKIVEAGRKPMEAIDVDKSDDELAFRHTNEGEHHHHHHDENWHIWMSPTAANVIAENIAKRLTEQFPNQKAKIAENLAKFKINLTKKDAEIKNQLATVSEKGYYTFHDAYGFFEDAYGLTTLGSFTINPGIAPGAKTIQAIKENITKNKAKCLFAEPQFTPKIIDKLSKGANINIGQLDPLGGNIKFGPNAYPEYLQDMANEFSQCLK